MSAEVKPLRAVEAWHQLRQGGHEPDLETVPSKRSAARTADGFVRFALGKRNEPRLLLPIPDRLNFRLQNLDGSLRLRADRLQEGGRTVRFLDLVCEDSGLEAAFGEVADTIVERIANGGTTHETCLRTLSEFRDLFRRESAADPRTVRGLVGELLFLLALVERDPSCEAMWMGPEGDRHDFRKRKDAFEVKTSGRSAADTIRISALDQLQAPTGGRLFLVRYVLESADGGEHSVASLASSILTGLGDETAFRAKLAAIGCNDPFASAWNDRSFNLEGLSVYPVKEGFPRLVEDSFSGGRKPDGVSGIEYDVDLSHASTFQMSQADYERLLDEVLS